MMIAGCEDPTPTAQQVTPPIADEKPQTEKNVADSAAQPEAGDPAGPDTVENTEPEKNESEYPYFHMYRDGDTLVVNGELKSNGQVEQIGSELEQYFTELKIENGLKKDPGRHAVGWGNRISDAVLFDYFSIVGDPEIEYKDGVILLKGSVKDDRELRMITEMVIVGFSDVWTHNLTNELKVGN